MERDEILAFSLLLVCSKAVLKREGKEKRKSRILFFPFSLLISLFNKAIIANMK